MLVLFSLTRSPLGHKARPLKPLAQRQRLPLGGSQITVRVSRGKAHLQGWQPWARMQTFIVCCASLGKTQKLLGLWFLFCKL